jgi:hypothetical protein
MPKVGAPARGLSEKGPVQGFLQAFQPHKLRGWAWLPAQPEEHLRIEVHVDGAVVVHTTAAMHFADLEKHQIGKGDHGFLINLRAALPADQPERVAVIAIAPDGTRRVLQLSAGARARLAPAEVASDLAPVPSPAPALTELPRPAPSGAAPLAFCPVDESQHPVFILGSARSGTTAMMQALRASGRYAGFNEGHLLPLFTRFDHVITNHYARSKRDAAPGMNTLIANVTQQRMMDAVQSSFVEVIRATFPTGYWLDKTPGPEMVRAAPLLLRMWPNARIIFMKRRPVDNIESRRRKFPSIEFQDHCRLWADSMMSWHAIRAALSTVSIEIDQATLAREPESGTAAVTALLQLDGAQAGRVLASLSNDRPQRTGKSITTTVALDSVDWTPAQRDIFISLCGEAMTLFGYDA